MIVDASALIAILLAEPTAERLRFALASVTQRIVSAATVLEAAMVMDGRKGAAGGEELDALLRELGIRIAPFDEEQLQWARLAFRMYGKGRHPAGLNFGDCFSYALSKATGRPLLFVGDDFARTDIAAVSW